MNILFCFDDNDGNYTRHCAVTIISLLETNKNHKIKIYVMTSSLSKENMDELKRIVGLYKQEIKFIIRDDIVPEDLKKVIINKNKLTWGAWYRLFFPKYIKGIDRILYMDCDVLVMKDISEIYNSDMHGKAIMGYYDAREGQGKFFDTDNYINSGVMLFDTKKYDMNNINVKKMEEINKKYGKYFTGSDQDKINVIFKDDIYVGPSGMNYQIVSKYFNKGINKAEIIHCIRKPYIKYSLIPDKYIEIYHKYLNMTKWKGFPIKSPNYGYLNFIYMLFRDFIFNIGKKILGGSIMYNLVLWKTLHINKKTELNNYNKTINPKVYIIMPCYNGEKYLLEQLMSIYYQNYANWYLIVVNDGSTDNSENILRDWISHYNLHEKVKIITKENGGLNSAITVGLEDVLKIGNVGNNYVSYCDADDIWTRDKLEIQVNYMIDNEEIGLSYHNLLVIDGNSKYCGKPSNNNLNDNNNLFTLLFVGNHITATSLMFKDIYIKQMLPFPNGYKMYQDYWTVLNILALNSKIGFINKSLAYYRKHEMSLLKTDSNIYTEKKFFESRLIYINSLKSKYKNNIFYYGEKYYKNRLEWIDKHYSKGRKILILFMKYPRIFFLLLKSFFYSFLLRCFKYRKY